MNLLSPLGIEVAVLAALPVICQAAERAGIAREAPQSEFTASCTLGVPMQCSVGPSEKAQAEFRERCTDMPSQCRFRADGSIKSWVDKFEMPMALNDDLVRRALAARTKRQLEAK